MLVIKDLSYQIGKTQIVKNCGFSLKPGTFTAVVGPNGAGKSSLLKAISNEGGKVSGTVNINGTDCRKLSSRQLSRIRAVMPQHTSINFPFSIEEVIEIGRFAHDTSPVENERIINEVIKRTQLDKYRGRTYQTLSGGERQRVQLARIMAQVWNESPEPRYLFLDEPTSDLDILHQHGLLGATHQLMPQNIGILAILHDLNLASQYADHIIFMKDGEIICQGPTDLVFTKENIQNTFGYPVQLITEPESGRTVMISIPTIERQNLAEKEIHYA